MTDRYTNNDIKLTLSDLRSKIRNGQVTLHFRPIPGKPNTGGGSQLRNVVANAFGIDADAFNTDNFIPMTLKRFAKLFDVPSYPQTSVDAGSSFRYPSQDDAAWALQNFINRRADVWSHVRPTPPKAEVLEANGVGNV